MRPSIKILTKSAQQWGVKLPTGSVEAAVETLNAYFVDRFGESVLWDCEACGNRVPDYDSNGNLVAECPFCGMRFEFEEENKEAAAEMEQTVAALEGHEVEPETTEEDADEWEEEIEDEDEDEEDEDEEDEVEPEEEPEEEPEKPAVPEKKKRGRKKKPESEKKAKPKAKAKAIKEKRPKKVPRKERVVIDNKPPADGSEFEYKGALANTSEELRKTIERIINLRNNIAINAYDIGTELNYINQHELWKNSEHKSFYDFCLNELEFSRASAYKYMLCAREFDRDTFLQIGVKKGELIASVGPTIRPKLIREAASGATHADLMTTINRLKGKPAGEEKPVEDALEVPKEKPVKPPEKEAPNWQGRIKLGEFGIPWLAEGTKNPIKQANVRSRYAIIPITESVELYIVPNKDETGLIACYRKSR